MQTATKWKGEKLINRGKELKIVSTCYGRDIITLVLFNEKTKTGWAVAEHTNYKGELYYTFGRAWFNDCTCDYSYHQQGIATFATPFHARAHLLDFVGCYH